MTYWRQFLAIPVLTAGLVLSGPPAGAQLTPPEEGPEEKGEPQVELEVRPDTLEPQSPEEETALRRARLDALFSRLAQEGNPAWESVQAEIWALWSQSGSPSMDLLLWRASKAMEERRFEIALRFLNDLVRLAPDFAEGWNKRATVYYLLGEFGHSVADIEHTLALEPRHFGALSGLGMILEQLGNKEGAIQAYRKGLELHPNLPGAEEGVKRLSADVEGREL